MSSKLGLIFSLIFVFMFVAMGTDLISVQYAISALDSKATAISYRIAKHGSLDSSFIKNIENEFNISFQCTGNCTPLFGDVVEYIISTEIQPMIMSAHEMTISIKRTAIIGFYA